MAIMYDDKSIQKLSSLEVEKRLYEEVENSLSRLGYESLPLVLLHNPKNLEDYFSDFDDGVFGVFAGEGFGGGNWAG